MERDEIESSVERAIVATALTKTGQKDVTFSHVPNKPLRDGGLGLGPTQYRAFLKGVRECLNGKKIFERFEPTPELANETYDKPLRVLRYRITETIFTGKKP